ncbi:MAG: hypothetical protein M1824_004422 [Vezdaea acicularis]|nr:MAG: hypothetical protein M1824_004422 [Vezdaea acicularis]
MDEPPPSYQPRSVTPPPRPTKVARPILPSPGSHIYHGPKPVPRRSSPPSPVLNKPISHPSNITRAAKPRREIFDPWNSITSGHQRADTNPGGNKAWRDVRNKRLGEQFGDASGAGGRWLDDNRTLGPQTRARSGLDKWLTGATKLKAGAPACGKGKKGAGGEEPTIYAYETSTSCGPFSTPSSNLNGDTTLNGLENDTTISTALQQKDKNARLTFGVAPFTHPSSSLTGLNNLQNQSTNIPAVSHRPPKQIFSTLVFYINGSTAPAVSDHMLKQLIAQHGGRLSISLGRRSVSHVILGRPNSAGKGAGGGLAGGKLEKEMRISRSVGVKYVSVDWILESIRAGIRLPEARFAPLSLARSGQKSIYEQVRRAGLRKKGGAKGLDGVEGLEMAVESVVEGILEEEGRMVEG